MINLYRGVSEGDFVYGSLVYSRKENMYYIIEHTGDELSYPITDVNTIAQYTGLSSIPDWEELPQDEQEDWLYSHTPDDWEDNLFFVGDILKHQEQLGVIRYNEFYGKYIVVFSPTVRDFSYQYTKIFTKVGNIISRPDLAKGLIL